MFKVKCKLKLLKNTFAVKTDSHFTLDIYHIYVHREACTYKQTCTYCLDIGTCTYK